MAQSAPTAIARAIAEAIAAASFLAAAVAAPTATLDPIELDCFHGGPAFERCCRSEPTPADCKDAAACCKRAFQGDELVRAEMRRLECDANRRIEGPRLEEVLALSESLTPEGVRGVSTSLKLKMDLIEIFAKGKPELQTAVEVGLGSSSNTVLLAAMFCKVLAIEYYLPVLERAITQRARNVFHLHMNSHGEPWRTFAQSECPSFVFIDGEHTFSAVKREIAQALDATTCSPFPPAIALHDYFLPGVRLAIQNFKDQGALHSCLFIGEERTAERAEYDRSMNQDPMMAMFPMEKPYHEGIFCMVDKGKAVQSIADIRPFPFSLQQPEGTPWQIYARSSPVLPIGSMKMFFGSPYNRFVGQLFFTEIESDKSWLARWTVNPSNSQLLLVQFNTDDGPQNGTMAFNSARTALVGHFFPPPKRRGSAHRRRGHWVNRTNREVFGDASARNRGPGKRPVWRGAFPLTEIFGLSVQQVLREFDDIQNEVTLMWRQS